MKATAAESALSIKRARAREGEEEGHQRLLCGARVTGEGDGRRSRTGVLKGEGGEGRTRAIYGWCYIRLIGPRVWACQRFITHGNMTGMFSAERPKGVVTSTRTLVAVGVP